MKKPIALLLCLLVCFTMFACGGHIAADPDEVLPDLPDSLIGQALTDYYMQNLQTSGGYDFALIESLMATDSDSLPKAIYQALWETLSNMELEDQQRFLSLAYLETSRRPAVSCNTSYVVSMRLSKVFHAVAEAGKAWMDGYAFPTEELYEINADVHTRLFSAILLLQTVENAATVQIPFSANTEVTQPVVEVSFVHLEYLSLPECYDYSVQFLSWQADNAHNFRVYQFRSVASVRFNEWAFYLDSLRTDSAEPYFYTGSGQQEIKDNLDDLMKFGSGMQAFWASAAMAVNGRGELTMYMCTPSEYYANCSIRTFCNEQKENLVYDWLEYSATVAMADYLSGSPENPDLNYYCSWFSALDSNGNRSDVYRKNLKTALEANPIEGRDSVYELTYEEMVWLEQFF